MVMFLKVGGWLVLAGGVLALASNAYGFTDFLVVNGTIACGVGLVVLALVELIERRAGSA